MDGDEWEIDEEDRDPDLDGWERGVAVPVMRATYVKRRLTVTVLRRRLWTDGDATGAVFAELSEAGVSVIELGETELENFGWELTVGFLADGHRAQAEQALETWSGRVGYRRVWFPDRIYEPHTPPRVSSRAAVECPTCSHMLSGRGPRFWRQVWEYRLFPTVCPICDGDLPQWRVTRIAGITPAERERIARIRKRLRDAKRRRNRERQSERGAQDFPGPTFAEELLDLANESRGEGSAPADGGKARESDAPAEDKRDEDLEF